MFRPGRRGTAKPAGAVRTRVSFTLIGCCFILGTTTAAAAAVSGPGPGSEGTISGRYQAIGCDTAAERDFGQVRAGADGARSTAYPGYGALRGRFRSRQSSPAIARYQSRNVISNSQSVVSTEIPAPAPRSADRTCLRNAISIAFSTSKTTPPGGPTDARRLFQLAVALAAAYVLFLVTWFWATREHRGRVGSAARS
jgi:hypothetical protein